MTAFASDSYSVAGSASEEIVVPATETANTGVSNVPA
jgi:hypothetical protein